MAASDIRGRLPRTPVTPGVTTFRGATLLDGGSGAPLHDADVEVREGIVRLRRAASAADDVDRGTIVDLAGTWLMPGFIDVHVHLAMVPAPAEEQRAWFPEQSVLAVAAELRATLEAGVTTVRDLDGLTPGYRLAVEQGTAIGPRLHLAIAMLSPTGGHADPCCPTELCRRGRFDSGCPNRESSTPMRTSSATVRRLVRMGADAIKVSTSGGTGSPTDEPEHAGVTQEQVRLIRRLVDERGGRPITAHALTDAAARAAVLGGADSIEHGYDLSDATIDLMLERGTVLVPTLSTLMREIGANVSPERRRAREALRARGMDSVSRAIAAGVPVALGTDAGMVPHGSNLRELAWLVEDGTFAGGCGPRRHDDRVRVCWVSTIGSARSRWGRSQTSSSRTSIRSRRLIASPTRPRSAWSCSRAGSSPTETPAWADRVSPPDSHASGGSHASGDSGGFEGGDRGQNERTDRFGRGERQRVAGGDLADGRVGPHGHVALSLWPDVLVVGREQVPRRLRRPGGRSGRLGEDRVGARPPTRTQFLGHLLGTSQARARRASSLSSAIHSPSAPRVMKRLTSAGS